MVRYWEASGCKPEDTALAVPFEGQCADALKALGGKVDRLAASENGLNDVGRQEGDLESSAHVARVYLSLLLIPSGAESLVLRGGVP